MPLMITTQEEKTRWESYSMNTKNYLANQAEVLGCGGNVSLTDIEIALNHGI